MVLTPALRQGECDHSSCFVDEAVKPERLSQSPVSHSCGPSDPFAGGFPSGLIGAGWREGRADPLGRETPKSADFPFSQRRLRREEKQN